MGYRRPGRLLALDRPSCRPISSLRPSQVLLELFTLIRAGCCNFGATVLLEDLGAARRVGQLWCPSRARRCLSYSSAPQPCVPFRPSCCGRRRQQAHGCKQRSCCSKSPARTGASFACRPERLGARCLPVRSRSSPRSSDGWWPSLLNSCAWMQSAGERTASSCRSSRYVVRACRSWRMDYCRPSHCALGAASALDRRWHRRRRCGHRRGHCWRWRRR